MWRKHHRQIITQSGMPPVEANIVVAPPVTPPPPPPPPPPAIGHAPVLNQNIANFNIPQGGSFGIASNFSHPDSLPMTYRLAEGTLPTGVTLGSPGAFAATVSATLGQSGDLMVYADDGISDVVTTFQLTTTAASGTYPFTIGMGFKKGDVPGSFCLDIPAAQVVVKRLWADGSVKHAIVSGRATLVQNVPLTISVISGHAYAGTALTLSDVLAASPTATLQCGTLASASLTPLLATTPFRIWIAGPEMIEVHYRANMGLGMSAWFYVRLYKDSRAWVRVICENGSLNGIAPADQAYTPVVTIGGTQVYTRAPVNITNIVSVFNASAGGYIDTITAPGHGLEQGMVAYLGGIGGMTQLNGAFFGIAGGTVDTLIGDPHVGAYSPYTGGGTLGALHCKRARWSVEGWSGGDPAITPTHNVAYYKTTKLTPYYGLSTKDETQLNLQVQTYNPLGKGNHTDLMWSADQQAFNFDRPVGVVPNWDAQFLEHGDVRAFRSVLANSSHVNSFPMLYGRDDTTLLAIKPSQFGTWSENGPGAGTNGVLYAGRLGYETAHDPSCGYLAYILTGDYWHYETLQFGGALHYLTEQLSFGQGLNRIERTQPRAAAWNQRTLGQIAAIAPDGDSVAAEYRTMLANQIAYFKTLIDAPGASQMGWPYDWSSFSDGAGNYTLPQQAAPFEHHHWCAVAGHLSEIETGIDETALIALRDFMYKGPIGILGASGPGNYCFTYAYVYKLTCSPRIVSASEQNNAVDMYQTWGEIFQATFGVPNAACGNTLLGSSGGDPAGGNSYWAILMAALAYAIDHGAPGADASLARVMGADNWLVLKGAMASGIGAQYAIIPRSGIIS